MSAGELEAACAIVGLAFADNPNTLAVTGGDRTKARQAMQVAVRAAKLDRKYSHVLVAAWGGRLIGVLNAAPWPNCQLRTIEKVKATPALVRALGPALTRQLKLVSAWATHDPREPHWHIGPVGVHPELQGRGVGSALVGSFLGDVDEEHAPAYLEADVDRNVALYERFGFTVIARETLLSVNNRFMWRAPKHS